MWTWICWGGGCRSLALLSLTAWPALRPAGWPKGTCCRGGTGGGCVGSGVARATGLSLPLVPLGPPAVLPPELSGGSCCLAGGRGLVAPNAAGLTPLGCAVGCEVPLGGGLLLPRKLFPGGAPGRAGGDLLLVWNLSPGGKSGRPGGGWGFLPSVLRLPDTV